MPEEGLVPLDLPLVVGDRLRQLDLQDIPPALHVGQPDPADRQLAFGVAKPLVGADPSPGEEVPRPLESALSIEEHLPPLRGGQFEIDLAFTGPEPADLRRGQSLQLRLSLSDPTRARLVPNGAFYSDTGGSWIFVVTPDGKAAVRRAVRLGRRNTEVIEVLGGLEVGERVLISPYTGFADKDRLDLTGS